MKEGDVDKFSNLIQIEELLILFVTWQFRDLLTLFAILMEKYISLEDFQGQMGMSLASAKFSTLKEEVVQKLALWIRHLLTLQQLLLLDSLFLNLEEFWTKMKETLSLKCK